VEKFLTDLIETCHCLVSADKTKCLSIALASPPNFHLPLPLFVQSAARSSHGDYYPLGQLTPTPDEVRTICSFLRVMILPGGQRGEEGIVIHFPFPVQHV
jgi:hypothetical protein